MSSGGKNADKIQNLNIYLIYKINKKKKKKKERCRRGVRKRGERD